MIFNIIFYLLAEVPAVISKAPISEFGWFSSGPIHYSYELGGRITVAPCP